MIVIVGESASGKSTLQNMFVENNKRYRKIVTYTTRPARIGERDGVDYHFVTNEEFDKMTANGEFIEHAQYRDWNYGTARKDCENDDMIAVLTPSGLRALRRSGFHVISVYLKVDRKSRMIKLLSRGDNIDEAYRRNLSDVGQFDGIANEVDYVIDNTGYRMDKYDILDRFETIINEEEHGYDV